MSEPRAPIETQDTMFALLALTADDYLALPPDAAARQVRTLPITEQLCLAVALSARMPAHDPHGTYNAWLRIWETP